MVIGRENWRAEVFSGMGRSSRKGKKPRTAKNDVFIHPPDIGEEIMEYRATGVLGCANPGRPARIAFRGAARDLSGRAPADGQGIFMTQIMGRGWTDRKRAGGLGELKEEHGPLRKK